MAGNYKQLKLVPDILRAAEDRAGALPIFENSHRKGDANLIGCIGEILFERLLTHFEIEFTDHREGTEYDYIVGGQYTVDVKTKDRTVAPRIDFDNSVPLYNHEHQRPDYYYFVSLFRDSKASSAGAARFETGFLLGGIDIDTLETKGKRWEAGQTDPTNGTTFWTACINVSMQELIPNKDLIQIFRDCASGAS